MILGSIEEEIVGVPLKADRTVSSPSKAGLLVQDYGRMTIGL